MVPRLEPIEKPDEPEVQSAYRMMRQEFGKVPTPVKVVTARMPGSLEVNRKLQKFLEGIQLEPELKLMVGTLSRRHRWNMMSEFPSKMHKDKS